MINVREEFMPRFLAVFLVLALSSVPTQTWAKGEWRKFNRALDAFFLTWDVMDAVERSLNPRLPPCPPFSSSASLSNPHCKMVSRGQAPILITNACDQPILLRIKHHRFEEQRLMAGDTAAFSSMDFGEFQPGQDVGTLELEVFARTLDGSGVWSDGKDYFGEILPLTALLRYRHERNNTYSYPLRLGCN